MPADNSLATASTASPVGGGGTLPAVVVGVVDGGVATAAAIWACDWPARSAGLNPDVVVASRPAMSRKGMPAR